MLGAAGLVTTSPRYVEEHAADPKLLLRVLARIPASARLTPDQERAWCAAVQVPEGATGLLGLQEDPEPPKSPTGPNIGRNGPQRGPKNRPKAFRSKAEAGRGHKRDVVLPMMQPSLAAWHVCGRVFKRTYPHDREDKRSLVSLRSHLAVSIFSLLNVSFWGSGGSSRISSGATAQ